MAKTADPTDPTLPPSARTSTKGRVPLLLLLGVLMLAILAGVILASGMHRNPGPADVGQPTYKLPDNRPSDAAAR
jgi:hypothetical protein